MAALGGSELMGPDPVSAYERMFASLVLIFCFLVHTALLCSMITARMTRAQLHLQMHDNELNV